ncbi:MAG: M20 family peptidase [Thermotogae bacterium]|nr:MAG: M20 family peptidase [Thermotogota bacterium]
MKEKIMETVDGMKGKLIEMARKIFEYAEVAFQEKKSSKLLADFLEKECFEVKRNVAGLETAFVAKYGSSFPVVALLAEYDALPGLGHACGHNMIGVISAGAGAALKKAGVLDEYEGTILVVGSPAEEKGAGKRILIENGVFKGVDVAMMIHPASFTTGFDISYALKVYKVEFFGKPSHAAADPEKGINALDSMIQLFSGIGLMRQQLPEKVRIHGIITNGGQAPNIIPEYTSAEIIVRALNKDILERITDKFKKLVEGSALMTGCRYNIEELESMSEVFVNVPLAKALERNFEIAGEEVVERTYEQGVGSTDMGDVTQVVPGIHAYVNITGGKYVPAHTHEFAEFANSEEGYEAMIRAVKALAMTCYDIFSSKDLLNEIKDYFGRGKELGTS